MPSDCDFEISLGKGMFSAKDLKREGGLILSFKFDMEMNCKFDEEYRHYERRSKLEEVTLHLTTSLLQHSKSLPY